MAYKTESDILHELATSLSKAQGEMDVALNNNTNPFFKSRYASFADIVRASRPALSKHGLSVTQKLFVEQKEHTNNLWMLETKLLHASGQWISSIVPIVPAKSDPQSLGSYITYMKRYAYAALVGVYTDDEDDDGNNATQAHKTVAENNANKNLIQQTNQMKPKLNYERVTSEQIQAIMFEIGEHTDVGQNLLKNFGIDKVADLPKEYYLKIIERIRANVKAKQARE